MPDLRGMSFRAVVAILGMVCAWAIETAAGPFPASQWQYRSSITLDNASGTEGLTDFPVLVKLNSANFDFTKANIDGSDIRFSDPANTPLSYEIETWNRADQQAAIWVKVPQVNPSSDSDYLQMFFGNAGATDAQSATDVWSNGYVGVWHMGGTGTAYDSTSGGHDGAVVGTGVTTAAGAIGDARQFDGSGSRIVARNEDLGSGTSSLDAGSDITISYWLKAAGGLEGQPTKWTRTLSKAGAWETQN